MGTTEKKAIRHPVQTAAPIKYFIVDFYSYALKLVIEIDGPIHEFQKEKDKEQEKEITALGNTIIRFSNEEVINDMPGVLTKIRDEISRIQSDQEYRNSL